MAVTYGFFNSVNGDRKYNADQMSEYFRGIVSQGVFQHLDSGMAVSAGTGLSVSVAAGRAIIQNRWVQNSAALNLTISDASETYGRKDAVVIRLDKSSRAISIAVKTGTPAASPVAPSMTRDETTYEMALAYVNVAAGASSVTVTDKRSDSSVCGWASVAQATSGEVDQMLNDMKTGFDGVVYSSPAAMVQGCDEVLQDEIDGINKVLELDISIDNSNLKELSNHWLPNVTINNAGNIVAYTGRIATPEKMMFNHEITIVNNNSPANLLLVRYDSDGSVLHRTYYSTQKVVIPQNTIFRVGIHTDETEITDVYDLAKNVLVFKSGYSIDLPLDEKRYTNLFDVSASTVGKSFDGETGDIVDASGGVISDYIAVDSDTSICMILDHTPVFNSDNEFYKIAAYDVNKNWLFTLRVYNSKLEDTNKWHNFNVNGYIRICIIGDSGASGITRVQKSLVILSNKAKDDKPFSMIPEKYISKIELFGYDIENNLDGYGYSQSTSNIVAAQNSSISGFIPIKWDDRLEIYKNGVDAIPVTKYVTKFALYDKNKNWIATIDRAKQASDPYYLTAPLRIDFDGYIRLQYWTTYKPLQVYTSSAVKMSGAGANNTVDVILFSGQSNMAGRGTAADAPIVPDGYAYEFKAITDPTKLYPLTEPFGVAENKQDGINDGNKKTGDMVAAFAIDYYLGNGNVPMVGVSASIGGTGIDDWLPEAETGYLSDALQRFEDCVAWLTNNGYEIRHKYLCWCQGEHDWETYDSYARRWQTMYDACAAVGIEKCLLVRIGNTNSGDGHFTNLIQTQTEMAETNPDIVLVSADLAGMADRGLMKDNLHYTQEAYNECGSYAGVNSAIFASAHKEPTMYDSENDNLYYSHKN